MRRAKLYGVPVDDVTLAETLNLIDGYIAQGRPHFIATTNTEFVMTARKDASFRATLNSADLSVPDGIGVILGLRLLGFPVREHVRGTDLVERLMDRAAARGYRVFLLGAMEGVAEEAANRLVERYPKLQIAGTYAGSSAPEHDDDAIRQITGAGPVDILLVAYGAPRQEQWIERNQERLGVPVAIGVGGVFDFLAGRVPRAPDWVRKIELEWLYRLIRQPWRWRRQLALPRFALLMLGLKLRQFLSRG